MRINKKLVKRLVRSRVDSLHGEYKNVEYVRLELLHFPKALGLLLAILIVGTLILTAAFDLEKWLLRKPTTHANSQSTSSQIVNTGQIIDEGSNDQSGPSPFDPNAGPDGKMTACQKQQYWLHRDFIEGVNQTVDMLLALYYQKECER